MGSLEARSGADGNKTPITVDRGCSITFQSLYMRCYLAEMLGQRFDRHKYFLLVYSR